MNRPVPPVLDWTVAGDPDERAALDKLRAAARAVAADPTDEVARCALEAIHAWFSRRERRATEGG